MELLVRSIIGNENYYQQAIWPLALALVISGVISWFLGKRLNKPRGRTLIDKETGEEVILKNTRHRLFFIPMEYWGPILLVIALIYVITKLLA
jgi:hypothetical protein